jgi:putative aldouronate transport system permease protein
MHKNISVWSVIKIIVLVFIVIITLFPFIYMISVSLSSSLYVMQNRISFYPKGLNLDMYKYILHNPRIFVAYKNTLVYVTLGTAISLSLTCMGAYALSKGKKLIFAKQLNIMVIITMYFSGGMIPLFLNVRSFGILDTIWAMVLPGAISAWNLIIMRSFFLAYPTEIEDSGYVDGLNDFGVFCYLVFPTSKAVLATIGLYYAVNLWNSFYIPYLYIESPEKYPLQVVLRDIVLAGTSVDGQTAGVKQDTVIVEDSLKFATIIVSIIPIIAVYPFIQKYFVKGVMVGSIKG